MLLAGLAIDQTSNAHLKSAIALSLNAIAVTRNHRDFSQIPGLQLKNWTEWDYGVWDVRSHFHFSTKTAIALLQKQQLKV